MIPTVDTPGERVGCLRSVLLVGWFLRYRRNRADRELDAEHPTWIHRTRQADQLALLAIQMATDAPDDSQAIAAVKAAGRKPKDFKRAATLIRADRYRYDRRTDRRAARLLTAAGGGPLVTTSSEEDALFRGVDRLEALPVEDAFAALATEVPALQELEHQILTSRFAPDWEDRDIDDRMDEILDNLDQLAGPRAAEGSPLIRSEVALAYARVHLLGKAVPLLEDPAPDPKDEPSEEAGLLAALARGYGVTPDAKRVAEAISRQVGDRNGFPTLAVLSLLMQEPGIGARLRRGDSPSGAYRKAMTRIIWSYLPGLSPAEFEDRVAAEVRSTLVQASAPTGDH
jgi:hypothetical protein